MNWNKRLTKRQKELLEFIEKFVRENDYSPSYQEIADHFQLSSKATVYEHIQNLKEKGYLKLDEGLSRSLSLTEIDKTRPAVVLPLVGTIAAGEPIEAIEDNETVDVPESMVGDKACYALKVRGNSMIEDGIFDGDTVVIERNYYPNNGDTVVALIDNESATLKRYYRERGRIRLQPANKTMRPLFVKNPTIQGIARAVIRKFK
ncbi:MAG: transcriptional repressor LexA [bacterium]